MNRKTQIPPLVANNTPYLTDSEKSHILAQTFAANFTPNPIPPDVVREVQNTLTTQIPQHLRPTTHPIFFPPSKIREIIQTLSPKKAPGLDSIPNYALKKLPINVILFLTKLFNSCFLITYYPKAWKIAKITPIPKPHKPKRLPSSYRPISLLSSLAKLLDILILAKVMEVVEERNLFPDFQYGFRPDHSTTQQLLRVCETITTNFNRGLYTGFVALDLEKAFDKVWHPGLLHKLHRQGFSPRIVKMIQAYLSNRSFRVVIQEGCLQNHPLLSGVPQSSCLGPILYTLYTQGIPTSVDHRTRPALYADDTAIYTTSQNLFLSNNLLQTQTDETLRFYEKWGLYVNPQKTQYVTYTKHFKIPDLHLTIRNHDVTRTDHVTYLGLTLDQRLTMTKHVNNIINKAKARLCTIAPAMQNSPSPVATLLYKSYIRPILTYASPVWYPLISRSLQKSLQIQQNKSLRLANKLPRRTPINILHNISGTPYLSEYILNMLTPRFAQSALSLNNPTLSDVFTPKFLEHPKYPSINYLFNP